MKINHKFLCAISILYIYSMGFQLDDTRLHPFQKWPQFWNFDILTGRNK
jgi:hypothetical protein